MARFADRVRGLVTEDAIKTFGSIDPKKTKGEEDIFIWSDATAQLIREVIDQLNYEVDLTKNGEYLSTLKLKDGYRRRYTITGPTAKRVRDRLQGKI